MGARRELGRHGRVHGYHNLLLLGHELVSLLHLVADPVLEALPEDGRADIDNPLLGDLRKVDLIRKVLLDLRLGADELQDALDGQVLVLRYVDRLDIIIVEISFLPSKDILQEVYGDVFCRYNLDVSMFYQ